MVNFNRKLTIGAVAATLALAGCEEGAQFKPFENFGKNKGASAASPTEAAATGTTVEREVEAPDVFQVQEAGLWDGRPSLGGVWVAHPDVDQPERVMIRNLDNGKFVVGALFRRELQNPGPKLQVSSDAAAELGLLAGAPTQVSVVALITETIEVAPEVAEPLDLGNDTIETTSLDPVATLAAAAIDAADTPTAKPEARPTETETAAAAPVTSSLSKPFIQIGIYSVKANADQTSNLLRNSGVIPTIKTFEREGKPYWRVVVGPAGTSGERSTLLRKIKGLGFADAYAVTN